MRSQNAHISTPSCWAMPGKCLPFAIPPQPIKPTLTFAIGILLLNLRRSPYGLLTIYFCLYFRPFQSKCKALFVKKADLHKLLLFCLYHLHKNFCLVACASQNQPCISSKKSKKRGTPQKIRCTLKYSYNILLIKTQLKPCKTRMPI